VSAALSSKNIPRHVAVIMDGNGRWARERGLPRIEGHRQGVESVRDVVKTAGQIGVGYLTLYAFSAENWSRPRHEVGALMRLLEKYLRDEIDELNENNVRLEAIGCLKDLPERVQKQLQKTKQATAQNDGLVLVLALSYGSRREITDAVRDVARLAKDGKINPSDINETLIANHLYTRAYPDPDLLIRTSGEMRISNFLLWQISYAELVVAPSLWPDFRKEQFLRAIEEYGKRDRRFGGI
jgi:undecaprenyl diphosphate synthase